MQAKSLTQKQIFIFWVPLAATWLMMAFEGPFLAAIIARMPMATINLAAYGVAYTFAILSEAPVIMMMAASTRLVKDSSSFTKLRQFNNILTILVTLLLAVGLWPPLFNFVTIKLINLPNDVAQLTHTSLLILLPWPGSIAYRRFLQGIMIANNRTRLVSYGTMVRVVVMMATAITLFYWGKWPGALIGAAALSAGVFIEMVASHFMASNLIKKVQATPQLNTVPPLSLRSIYTFYYPLAIAAFIGLTAQPLVTLLVGNSYMALESLAVLPVINALIFIFRSIGLSFQEVNIALIGEKREGYAALKKFAIRLGTINLVVLALIVFTPLVHYWFETVSGLEPALSHIAQLPAQILVLIPALTVLISFQRSIQVIYNKTGAISVGTFIEVAVIVVLLFTLTTQIEMIGATAAAWAIVGGRIASNSYLGMTNFKARKSA